MAVAGPCWSDLPLDILFFISKRIAAANDISGVLRFRSVCASWRSSCPPPTPRLPCFSNYELRTLKLDAGSILTHIFDVHTRSLFLVKSPLDHRSWLVKSDHAACSSSDGRRRRPMKLYCPLSGSRGHYLRNTKLVLDLSKFQVIELGQEHIGVLNAYLDEDLLKIHKPTPLNKWRLQPDRVALIPTSDHHFILFAKLCVGVLAFFRSEDAAWTHVLGNNSTYHPLDLASFNGRFYAVDGYGKTCVVDQSANLTWFSGRAFPDLSSRLISRFLVFLVESEGELLLVDVGFCTLDSPEPIRLVMYKLNVERSKWDRVQLKLGNNQVLFLGEVGSFSISAAQLGWPRGNFIFFGVGSSTYVYDLERDGVTSLDHRNYDHPNHLNLLLSPPLEWFQESHKSRTSMRSTCARLLGAFATFFVLGLASVWTSMFMLLEFEGLCS